MGEKLKKQGITEFILNPEYAAEGSTSITLLLKCISCNKQYKITKFATLPSSEMPEPEPEKEIVGNILNTAGLEHFTTDHCSGSFSYQEYQKV